jgi:hypothetical protein
MTEKFLKKDGHIHSYQFTVESKAGPQLSSVLFNEKLNTVLEQLQNNGYMIMDIKMSAGFTVKLAASMCYLILYK